MASWSPKIGRVFRDRGWIRSQVPCPYSSKHLFHFNEDLPSQPVKTPPEKLWRAPWNNRDSHDSKCLKEKPTCFRELWHSFWEINRLSIELPRLNAWGIPTKTHPKSSFNQAPKIAAILVNHWTPPTSRAFPEISDSIRFCDVMIACLNKLGCYLPTSIYQRKNPTTLTWKCENLVSWISEDSRNLKTKQIIVRWLQPELTINPTPGETKQMTMETQPQLGGVSPKKELYRWFSSLPC